MLLNTKLMEQMGHGLMASIELRMNLCVHYFFVNVFDVNSDVNFNKTQQNIFRHMYSLKDETNAT